MDNESSADHGKVDSRYFNIDYRGQHATCYDKSPIFDINKMATGNMTQAQPPHHPPWWQLAGNSDQVAPPSSFSWDELIKCSQGKLFSSRGPVLPAPPMLAFDNITHIAKTDDGPSSRGEVTAEWVVRPDEWFFGCHFLQDPVMPGCLGLDALWQLTGFYMGWLGHLGCGRALGAGKVQFTGQVLPSSKLVRYSLEIKRVITRPDTTLCLANGTVSVGDALVYRAQDLRVGLFTNMKMFDPDHHE